jgi:hypothetical protein
MENILDTRSKLFLGGDKNKHIGWVDVYNGVNVIEYNESNEQFKGFNNFMIIPIGNSLKEEAFGAFERGKHPLPY